MSDNLTKRQIEKSLTKLAKNQNIQIIGVFYLPDEYISRHMQQIEQIIDASYKKTRSKWNQLIHFLN